MKVKELQKMMNVAWSPSQQNPILLAAGTAAQQLDASFNTAAALELYSINLSEAGFDMAPKGSQSSAHRFNKLIWSPTGFGGQHANGLIVGGCENGYIQLYSAAKLLAGEDALIGRTEQNKHSGSVFAVDYNPFQTNLLASGATESEIFIWDLNNITTPMTPGTKIQPNDNVLSVNWNRQVQHILASVFSAKCVIWDLRKNEPIIKLHDSQSRVRWRALQWHPTVATQLWLASEEDQAPVVQLWDLRYATAPARQLQMHQRGVLGLAWCAQDSDLIVSCSKDGKIIAWNPNSELPEGEVLAEIDSGGGQWSYDVLWCPRSPALIAGCSFDGSVSVYSLHGGSQAQVQTTSKIADSFPGMDPFAQAPAPQQAVQSASKDLKRPPKWLRRSAGARFGFGGKLFSFNATSRAVTVSQVVTDEELVQRSNELETVLNSSGDFVGYCRKKAEQAGDEHTRYVWCFLKAYFEDDPRAAFLNLLDYQPNDIAAKFSQFVKKDDAVDQISDQMAGLNSQDSTAVFDSIAAGQKLLNDRSQTVEKKASAPYRLRAAAGDEEGLICEALFTGNVEAAVELCMRTGRTTDAVIIASTGPPELLSRTQFRYLSGGNGALAPLVSALVTRDWSEVAQNCSLDSWREALVAALTHAIGGEMSALCETVGERLQAEGDPEVIRNAILCYICAGSVERLVDAWQEVQRSPTSTPKKKQEARAIQELVEVVMILQKAMEVQQRGVDIAGHVADILAKYAGLLASQGALNSALTYLGPSLDPELVDLKERLYYALGIKHQAPQSQQNYYSAPTPPASRFSQQRTSIGAVPQFNTSLPGTVTAQPTSYFTPQPAMPQPAWNQTAPAVPPPSKPPADVAPPRPGSTGPPQGGSHLSRKYVLDPSVQSGPTYGAPSYGGGMPPYNQAPAPASVVPQFNQFNTAPLNTFTPAPVEMGQPALQPPPVAPMNVQRNPTPPPGWNDPPAPSSRANRPPPTYAAATSEMSAVHSGAKQWRRVMQSHSRTPVQPSSSSSRPPSALESAPKADLVPVAPITHPLFGQDPNAGQTNGYTSPDGGAHPPPPMGVVYPPPQQQQQQQQPFVPVQAPQPGVGMPPYQAQQQQPQAGQFNYQNFQQGVGQQQQPPQQLVRQTPEPPKPKPPLPEEFVYMQTVFDELRTQCIRAATNPQTKRKLDDVGKRLENLYDMLREKRLTQNTLVALNQLVQMVQVGDYANGLALHTSMAAGSDFATIASFMPGIKVLLQTAMQLQVYLR